MYKQQNLNGRVDTLAIANIKCSTNNTLVTFSDGTGNVLCCTTGGSVGFKGSQRASIQAAQLVGEKVGAVALRNRQKRLKVVMKGLGVGRLAVLKGLRKAGVLVEDLLDLTPVSFGGCRAPKKRRLKSKRR